MSGFNRAAFVGQRAFQVTRPTSLGRERGSDLRKFRRQRIGALLCTQFRSPRALIALRQRVEVDILPGEPVLHRTDAVGKRRYFRRAGSCGDVRARQHGGGLERHRIVVDVVIDHHPFENRQFIGGVEIRVGGLPAFLVRDVLVHEFPLFIPLECSVCQRPLAATSVSDRAIAQPVRTRDCARVSSCRLRAS